MAQSAYERLIAFKGRLMFKKYFRQTRQNLELTCGKEPLRKMAVCMKFRFIPGNTGEQNWCSSDIRSDKEIERNILQV